MSERRPPAPRDRGSMRRAIDSGRGVTIALGLLLVFLVITYAVVLNALRPKTPGTELTLDEVVQRVGDRQITEVTLLAEDFRLVGTDPRGRWWAGLANNEAVTSQLLNQFIADGVRTRIDTQVPKSLLRLSTGFLLPGITLFVSFAFLYTLFRGAGGGRDLVSLGRSRARRYVPGQTVPFTFADVAGMDEAIEELREVKDFLASPETFEALGAKPPRGILLSGPPGCGKTLLAKAVAGEARVPFFSISASQFLGMLVGVGPARVRDLFEKARAAAPSIIFIDELDAAGRARASGDSLNPEGESTLNELLVQLDGFDPSDRVVLMAATNRPDVLDPALMRKGRFDRQIVIDAPDFTGRLAIAKVHARGKPLGTDLDLERFARRTVGLSGADIAAALNEAATLAARRRLSALGARELSEAVDRVMAGPERHSRILGAEEKRRVAYHEAGHTIVGWVFDSSTTVDKVSIVARGHSLGSTWSLPTDDRRLRTRAHMEEEITTALAGRAAEEVVFADPSNGSALDLSRASVLARHMVYDLGMSEALGPLVLGSGEGAWARNHSEATTEEADREVRRMLDQADHRARAVLTAYRSHLDRLAETLILRETMERPDLEAVLGDLPPGPPPGPGAPRPGGSGPARPAPVATR
ncbi:MAG: ATP-dependent zinc metalloprotease FtsH [Acidimicrobiales bacterium]